MPSFKKILKIRKLIVVKNINVLKFFPSPLTTDSYQKSINEEKFDLM